MFRNDHHTLGGCRKTIRIQEGRQQSEAGHCTRIKNNLQCCWNTDFMSGKHEGHTFSAKKLPARLTSSKFSVWSPETYFLEQTYASFFFFKLTSDLLLRAGRAQDRLNLSLTVSRLVDSLIVLCKVSEKLHQRDTELATLTCYF